MDPLLAGLTIAGLDVVVWRCIGRSRRVLLVACRLTLFAALTWLLYANGMSPLDGTIFPDHRIEQALWNVLEIMWWFIGARLLTVVLDIVFMQRSWHQERLFQDLLGAVVFLASTVAAVAYVLHWPVRGLIATSGALAIIVGLAVQSTLSDLFSGLVINTTQPYLPGDWVVIDDTEGSVVEMNWRATHLLNGRGNIVVIPNNVAAKAKISNASRPSDLHGIALQIEITPEARPATAIQALTMAVAGCTWVLPTPAPVVSVKSAGVQSITYEIVCYVRTAAGKTDATNELYDLAHRHLAASRIELRSLGVAVPDTAPEVDSRARLLSRIELFATLDRDVLVRLAARLTRREYEENDAIARGGEVAQQLMIVASGVVSVTMRRDPAEAEVELYRLGPEESFGESGILSGVELAVDVVARTRVVVYGLDRADLTPLLKAQPELGVVMCRILSRRQGLRRIVHTEHVTDTASGFDMFDWLSEGMRRLHDLAS